MSNGDNSGEPNSGAPDVFGPVTDFGDSAVSDSGDQIGLTLVSGDQAMRVHIPTSILDLVISELQTLRETASARLVASPAGGFETQALAVITGIAVEPQDELHIAVTVQKRDGGSFGFVLPRANVDDVCEMMRDAGDEDAPTMTRQ